MRNERSFMMGNAVPFAASYDGTGRVTPNYKATFVWMMLAGIGGGIATIGFTDGFEDAKQREEAAYNSDFHGFHNVLHHVAAGLTVFVVAAATFAIGFGANKAVRACVDRRNHPDAALAAAAEAGGLLGEGDSGAATAYAGWRANCQNFWLHPVVTGVALDVLASVSALAAVAETTGVKAGWNEFADTPYAHVVGAGMFMLLAGATVGGLAVATHAAGVGIFKACCGERRSGAPSADDGYGDGGSIALEG